jgi:hypothetical protein
MVKNIRLPSTEPHVDRRRAYSGVRPCSPRGSLTTLLSLPQCHAAVGTIPSTLAWVDRNPVTQCVQWQPSIGHTLHTCYHIPRDQSRVDYESTPRRLALWEAFDPLTSLFLEDPGPSWWLFFLRQYSTT